ncbi:HAD family hydrolase [Roseitalea porphyridii]|uniref:HAD family phosphatase n=1 Tax=Roseitalea porphyridii TaxID=1852022 RepID=A0A4P6V4U2_9HYPH|nr:HAD family phosphatase [Roseitalea porphyridii]QBK31819.1 HAD family phosphatase [Roseitalea porphyridii]
MDNPLMIFDCDGVLIDSEAVYLQVELGFLAAKGVSVDRDWYVGAFMALAADKWRRQLSDLLLERTGAPLTDDDYVALKSESRRRVIEDVRPIAGIDALLRRLTAPRCVASSTQLPFLPLKLERAGLDRFFGENVFSGDMVENGKPSPDLFELAARRMGFSPGDCITVEDSANGVRGARAAGQFVIGFTGGGHWSDKSGAQLRDAGADMVVASHAELADWLSENTGALVA